MTQDGFATNQSTPLNALLGVGGDKWNNHDVAKFEMLILTPNPVPLLGRQ